jgi:5-(carboxyamino)imidazole ribonucleotide synthase
MSIQAAQRMGLRCLSLDPGEITPASQVAPALVGSLSEPGSIARVLEQCDRVTLENEFIPAEAIREALEIAKVDEDLLLPGVSALANIQDKLLQRNCYEQAGVPSPKAVPIDGSIDQAVREIGFPMVLKARFGGYDGRGTRYARTPQELEGHRPLWESGGWMAEAFVPFRRELAVMVFVHPEDRLGEGCFPTMETIQRDHVCDLVFPGNVDASGVAQAAVRAIGGRGLYGVELFELADGSFQVNEMAPRPHNTGHFTLDWGGVSQFEQHVRLVMGFPCVQPEGQPTCMANLLGQPGATDYRNGLRAALEGDSGARVHWYAKAESRPGRKMGHLNVVGDRCVERAREARHRFYEAWTGSARTQVTEAGVEG